MTLLGLNNVRTEQKMKEKIRNDETDLFLANFPGSYPLRAPENLWYNMETLATNGLN